MNILAKRIPSILGLAVLVAGLAGGAVLVQQRQQAPPRAAAGGEPIDLAIANISDQSFSVSWTTAEKVTGRVLLGTRWINDVRDSQAEMSESTTHFVTVDGLAAANGYEFRVESGGRQYDSQGKQFSVTTAASLVGSLPAADVAQGIVKAGGGTGAAAPSDGAAGAIVYAQLPGGQLLSALSAESGNWVIPLSTSRIADLSSWLSYDRTATVYTIRADGAAAGKATATVITGIDQPVPPIVLGQNYDFRQTAQEQQATSNKQQATSQPSRMPELNLRSLFNFEDLGPVTPMDSGVTLLNPGEDGEKISTTRPELFGEGPKNLEVNITVESPETVKGNAMVDSDGRWKFAMPTDLAFGSHTVTLQWIDAEGVIQILKRSFVVQAASGEPAFTASPSATPKDGQATPTKKLTPTPQAMMEPRKTVSATASETPKSGGLTASATLFIIGLILVAAGSGLMKQPIRYG